MQPDFELGPLDANEITSTTASTAIVPRTPPSIQISRLDRRLRARRVSACPGGMISTALLSLLAACARIGVDEIEPTERHGWRTVE